MRRPVAPVTPRRTSRALLALVVAAAALVACGIDIVGQMAGSTGTTEPTEGGAIVEDAGTSIVDGEALPEVPVDAAPDDELIGDAGVVATDCGVASIVDNFNGGVGPEWKVTGDAVGSSSSGNGYVRLIQTDRTSRNAGLFFVPGVSATSFNMKFRYFAQRPPKQWWESDDVGDGLTFVWLTSGDPGSLANANNGHTLGVPRMMGGGAFALDVYRNSSIGDPSPPSFSLLKIDPTRGDPGSYDWHLKNRGPYSNLYDLWRDVTITYADGLLTASVSGTSIFNKEPVPVGKIVAIGFTASTGGADGVGFFVDSVQLDLTDATCP